MIVTSSRKAAITYKEKLDQIKNAPESTVIISKGDTNDLPEIKKWTNSKDHELAIQRFQKPMSEDSLSILIVNDMLLTGFDSPICQVMYLDRQLKEHTLLQAIARVNRTKAQKFRGYIIDYYGLTDYLKEALAMFSTTDTKGALRNLKDEIPKLEAAHTKVIRHFKDTSLKDSEKCIALLKEETKRQEFESDFRDFSKQVEIVLPDKAALPFIRDLKALGKICIEARNRYRDPGLDIIGCGNKVKTLIEEHVYAIGIDPRVPPTKLFDESFLKAVDDLKDGPAKASEVEQAIRAHIRVKIEEDPETYKSLSLRLEEIIQGYENKWDELVEQLLLFRADMDSNIIDRIKELKLNELEFPFYNILMAEITKESGADMDEATHQKVLDLVRELVNKFEKSAKIVGFFRKENEKKAIKREIKRAMDDLGFKDRKLINVVQERFIDLGKVKFK